MGLLQITFAATGIFALLNWLIIPRLRWALAAPLPARPLRLMVTLMIASLLRSASLVAAIAFGGIVIAFAVVTSFASGFSTDQLASVFHLLTNLRERIEAFDGAWSIIFLGVLSIALWISVRRDAQKRLSAAIDHSVARLHESVAAGSLPELADTPEMARIAGVFGEVQAKLHATRQSHEPEVPPEAAETAALEAQAKALHDEYVRLDLLRRLDISAEVSMGLGFGQHTKSRIARFVGSVGLLQAMSGVSRVPAVLSSCTARTRACYNFRKFARREDHGGDDRPAFPDRYCIKIRGRGGMESTGRAATGRAPVVRSGASGHPESFYRLSEFPSYASDFCERC